MAGAVNPESATALPMDMGDVFGLPPRDASSDAKGSAPTSAADHSASLDALGAPPEVIDAVFGLVSGPPARSRSGTVSLTRESLNDANAPASPEATVSSGAVNNASLDALLGLAAGPTAMLTNNGAVDGADDRHHTTESETGLTAPVGNASLDVLLGLATVSSDITELLTDSNELLLRSQPRVSDDEQKPSPRAVPLDSESSTRLTGTEYSQFGVSQARQTEGVVPADADTGRPRASSSIAVEVATPTEAAVSDGATPGAQHDAGRSGQSTTETMLRFETEHGAAFEAFPTSDRNFSPQSSPSPHARSPNRALPASSEEQAEVAPAPNISSAVVVPSRRSRAYSEATSPNRQLVTPPVHIRSEALGDGSVAPPRGGRDIPKSGRATELPSELGMPMALRCDFCQKFDSVCFTCHFKWKKILADRRASVAHAIGQLPEGAQNVLLLASVAKGTMDFVDDICAVITPQRASRASCFFVPLERDSCSPLLRSSGYSFPLHIACAYQRMDAATHLLRILPSAIRRSENKHLPFQYLPFPLEPSWEAALLASPQYVEHVKVEKARSLRSVSKFSEAEAIYEEVLASNPSSEHALCGRAKMAFDQDDFPLCVARCDALIKPGAAIAWSEFSVATVESLRQHAMERFHEVSHAVHGPALKPCGDIITTRVRLRVRRLSWEFFEQKILCFASGSDLFYVWTAIRHIAEADRGLNSYISRLAVAAPRAAEGVFSTDPSFKSVIATIRTDAPRVDDKLVSAPASLASVQIVAVADFFMLILRAIVEGANPEVKQFEKSGFFERLTRREPPAPKVFLRKDYRAYKPNSRSPWQCAAVGEWERFNPEIPQRAAPVTPHQ